MNIFDIIGPVMIGPSSSHTAGAVRLGKIAAKILGEDAAQADIALSGSFAETYRGHGTDRAIVAGLLGFSPDDGRIPASFDIAREKGLAFSFSFVGIPRSHPNTARILLAGVTGKRCSMQGASVGGGNVLVVGVNGMETSFTGTSDTLIIAHTDMPGMIAQVTLHLATAGINIGNFKLNRRHKGFRSVMTLEIDGELKADALDDLRRLPHIDSVVYLRASADFAYA
jgi:L-serine dehydratase